MISCTRAYIPSALWQNRTSTLYSNVSHGAVSNMMCPGSYVVQDKFACACMRNDGGDQPRRYAIKNL